MGAPTPEGPTPWQRDVLVAGPSAGLQRDQGTGNGQEARSPAHRRTSPGPERVTPWLWLSFGLSTMLLVLFAVVVNRQQAQVQRIGELSSRVKALEQSRALERTAVLEQQLRAMLTRLQDLEKQNQRQEQLGAQLESLQGELRRLRSSPTRSLDPLDLPAPLPPAPVQARPRLVPKPNP